MDDDRRTLYWGRTRKTLAEFFILVWMVAASCRLANGDENCGESILGENPKNSS